MCNNIISNIVNIHITMVSILSNNYIYNCNVLKTREKPEDLRKANKQMESNGRCAHSMFS